MPTSSTSGVIERLRAAVLPRDGAGASDADLLGRFVDGRDESALAALVHRHGPMVWGVCRRMLSHHDAEDAFQAAFLVLVRKAASVRPRVMVGNWLYGVARQTALLARRTAARRRAREAQVTELPDTPAPCDRPPDDLPLLDEELARLPDIYRSVVVLCDLQGRTRAEAARQLAVPEGTVAGRLARARALLAKRLARRGVGAAALASATATASVPGAPISSTIHAAELLATGHARAAIGPQVAALTRQVLNAMLTSKLKVVAPVVLALGLIATGASVVMPRTAAQSDPPPVTKAPVKAPPAEEKDTSTAWGEAAGGLQAGIGFKPGEKRAYHPGEKVTLVVRVRNVGKEEVKFQYLREYFLEHPPAVTGPDGKPVTLGGLTVLTLAHVPVDVTLAPGKVVEITGSQPFYELKLEHRTKPDGDDDGAKYRCVTGTGKFTVRYDRVFGNSSAGRLDVDAAIAKLGTGALEFEVTDWPKK